VGLEYTIPLLILASVGKGRDNILYGGKVLISLVVIRQEGGGQLLVRG
jgi:hypothetical protein